MKGQRHGVASKTGHDITHSHQSTSSGTVDLSAVKRSETAHGERLPASIKKYANGSEPTVCRRKYHLAESIILTRSA